MIVIDSVAALVPKTEIEGEMGDTFIGLQARLMSQALRKLTGHINWSKTVVIFINQLRSTISTGYSQGPTETTAGGRALNASQRIEIRKGDKIMEDKEQIGYFAKIKIAKNKIFAPFKTAELPIKWNMGYDKTTDIIEAALILKLISKAGAFYTLGSEKLQGKEKLAKYLEGEEKIRANLEKEIQSKIKDMRMGKKVLDDEALNKMEAIIEEESQSVEEE